VPGGYMNVLSNVDWIRKNTGFGGSGGGFGGSGGGGFGK
jgi:hypothetical protein